MRCSECEHSLDTNIMNCLDCYGGSNFKPFQNAKCCHIVGIDFDGSEPIISTSFDLNIKNHYIIKSKDKEIFNFCPRCGKKLEK